MRTQTALLTGVVAALALAACTSFPLKSLSAGLRTSPAVADGSDLGPGDGGPRKDLQCDGAQQSETSTTVTAACAFDRGAEATREAQIAADRRMTDEYSLAMDRYLSDSAVQASVTRLPQLSQPKRAEEGQYLLEHNHLLPVCAFDDAHQPDFRHLNLSADKPWVFTVSCDPPKPKPQS